MAIYQGDIGIHDIKLGSIDVFEIYQGSKLVYPENTETTITFKLNVSGTVTINGYTPVISENNTKFVFTIPVKINYTAIIEADHYKSQTITGNSGYLPITHNVELEWEQRFISYTVIFPTDGVKVLFDGIEKGVITNGKLVVLIDDTEAKDSYTVTFSGSKASTYNTSGLKVVDSSIAATGGSYDLKLSTSSVKTAYTRTDYASSTGSITKGSTYTGSWIETVVNLTASFTSSTTLGSISNNVLTIANNESTNTKSGTLTVTFTLENSQTKQASGALNQAAGSKVYTDWVLDLQTDGTSVEAKGGTRTITANVARRTYKWNNTGTVYSETATPTLSISGSASLNGNSIIFTSNESVSARSAVLTASYVGLSKTVTITQAAGSKVYSAWSAWTVSISASTQTIGASGGTSTITTSASRSRTWTWNGVGTTHTDTETGTPTLSGTATGFTLSGTTVTASNNESTNSRSINITATHSGVTKSITISQSAGSKVYGSWSKWTINKSSSGTTIAASGGSGTVSAPIAIRTRSYTWNGTGTSYTEQGTGTPTLTKQSGDGSFSVSGTTATVSYGNNTTTSSKSTVVRATMDTEYVDTTFTQSAGSKVYGNWSSWSVSCSASSYTVSASGGSVTIYRSASRSRSWTWNGVSGSGGTESESGTPTLSASGSGSLSETTLSYGNNTSTSSRTTRITASYDDYSDYCDVTQSAGSKTYGSWGAWTITLTANPTTIAAAGGNSTLSTSATRSRTWQWNGTGTTYTEQGSGTPTLSKVSGAATLNSKTVNYGNNTSTNSRSSVFRATIDSATKDITIIQSAGSLVYQNVIYHTTYYGTGPDTGIDSTTYPNVCEIDKDISSKGELIYVYYKIYTTQKYTWNGVEGSGGTTYKYYTASDIVAISKVNCDVLVGNDSTVGDNMIAFGIQVLSNSSTSSRTWYVEWRWLGSQNNTTRGTQQGSPVVGRFCIKNNKFTTNNIALPVYINSMNVDTIYDGETTYNNIISSPVSVYVYIPTNVSTFYSGKLQFWFEHEDDSDDKYNCSLSNYSTVSGISISNNGTIIGVNSNTTISGFTILCQFTMTSNNIVFNIRVLVEA
ncbi:bacon domain containing protein [CrAssphage LMMB]|nr:bacon domain containing protein [CrAssphage LMMB]